jgi:hypothetical protein
MSRRGWGGCYGVVERHGQCCYTAGGLVGGGNPIRRGGADPTGHAKFRTGLLEVSPLTLPLPSRGEEWSAWKVHVFREGTSARALAVGPSRREPCRGGAVAIPLLAL